MSNQSEQEDIWITATGEEDGKPLIFRSRQKVPFGITESDYPTLVTIYWNFEVMDNNGMPNSETNNAQIEFEDALEVLDSIEASFLMLVVTGNGRKEWHWYVSKLDNWINRLNEQLTNHPEYPIEIENSQDPDWSLYHNFISGVQGI